MTKQVLKSEMHSDSTRTQLIPAAPAGMALVSATGSVTLTTVSYVAMVGCSPSAAATGTTAAVFTVVVE